MSDDVTHSLRCPALSQREIIEDGGNQNGTVVDRHRKRLAWKKRRREKKQERRKRKRREEGKKREESEGWRRDDTSHSPALSQREIIENGGNQNGAVIVWHSKGLTWKKRRQKGRGEKSRKERRRKKEKKEGRYVATVFFEKKKFVTSRVLESLIHHSGACFIKQLLQFTSWPSILIGRQIRTLKMGCG